jgi:hypothetical protein
MILHNMSNISRDTMQVSALASYNSFLEKRSHN